MVITPRLDVRVRQEEDRENNRNNVPAGEDEPAKTSHINVSSNSDNPLRQMLKESDPDSREGIDGRAHPPGIVERRERNHGGDLEEAHLQRIRRTDLHATGRGQSQFQSTHMGDRSTALLARPRRPCCCSPQRDVAGHGERHGVHEFRGIGHECEERQAEELFVDPGSLHHDVHDIDEDLCGYDNQ